MDCLIDVGEDERRRYGATPAILKKFDQSRRKQVHEIMVDVFGKLLNITQSGCDDVVSKCYGELEEATSRLLSEEAFLEEVFSRIEKG